jgi:hypothetical protein
MLGLSSGFRGKQNLKETNRLPWAAYLSGQVAYLETLTMSRLAACGTARDH